MFIDNSKCDPLSMIAETNSFIHIQQNRDKREETSANYQWPITRQLEPNTIMNLKTWFSVSLS